MNKTNAPKDTQANAYIMTCNNPAAKGYETHTPIKDLLMDIPKIDYWCLCDEIGLEKQTPHIHIYFHATQGIRHSTLRNKFVGMDIQAALGNAQQCRDYIRKEGAYIDSEKKETNLIDTFEEWGNLPVSKQGRRTDLELMYDLVKDGKSDSEILEICPETAIKHIDKIAKLRLTYLRDKYKSQRRLDLKVHYITGKTGKGKSRDILDEYGDENVYRVTDYQHPFDSYQCEPVLVFEEFRSSLRLQDMLNYLDIYPVTLPARYSPKQGCFDTVIVVSNWDFDQQYGEVQKDLEQKSTYEAWVRRFNGHVKVYTDSGIITYPTMQDYLNRHFKPLPPDVQTPFDEPEPKQQELSLDDATDQMPFDE